jgi:hypothetical protein
MAKTREVHEPASEAVVVGSGPTIRVPLNPAISSNKKQGSTTKDQSGDLPSKTVLVANRKSREVAADELTTAAERPCANAPVTTYDWRLDKEGKLERLECGIWKDVGLPPEVRVKKFTGRGDILWVVTTEGQIYRSTINQSPWVPVNGGWSGKVQDLEFSTYEEGWAVVNGEHWITHDGGKTWSKQPAR